MEIELIESLLFDLLVVLSIGFFTGIICKKISLSLIAGYFIVGAIVGQSGFNLISHSQHEIEYLAHAGAMLLLFSVGIEFSINELSRSWKHILVGGTIQMTIVTIPLIIICQMFKMDFNIAIIAALAASLSSTVLVFKALSEWGESTKPHGQRALGILIFQDIALVPLILFVPILADSDKTTTTAMFGQLFLKSFIYILLIVFLRKFVVMWLIPMIYKLRSIELVVLFTFSLLLANCFTAHAFNLPAAIGALTTGLMLSDNRLSNQIDAVILPFREIFASVFFVSLGLLLKPNVFLHEPFLILFGLLGIIILKTFAGTTALRITGLDWKTSFGMGIGLSQLGEFSFLLISSAMLTGALNHEDYNRMLFIALISLIVTPQLIKFGISIIENKQKLQKNTVMFKDYALIIGMGLVGRQAKVQLEKKNFKLSLIDQSALNLHDFSSQGMHTIMGDARNERILKRAQLNRCHVVAICVTEDEISYQIIKKVRELNSKVYIVVYCRFKNNLKNIQMAGANKVITEELEIENYFKEVFELNEIKTTPIQSNQ